MRHSPAILATTVAALACALFLAGCGDDPNERHFDRKITPVDIVGTWRMTDAAQDLLRRDGHVEIVGCKYTITFINDGWLKFESVIDDVKGGTYFNCNGTWRLDNDVVVDNEKRANVVEIQLRRPNDRYFRKLGVTEEGGNLRLWNFYGDPKFAEFIEYERPGAKPKTQGW